MYFIQKIRIADCDGGGNQYVVCDDQDRDPINNGQYFDTEAEAEKYLKELTD